MDIINAYKMLVGKPERKRPIGRTGRGWKDTVYLTLRKYCGGDEKRDRW
jgi:hypothetical protein